MDGTGIKLSATYYPNPTTFTLINKNGIQFPNNTWSGSTDSWLIEDPNGNELTFSQSCPSTCGPTTMTDTLGRTWTTTYGSTNTTNCPVTATSATLWDTPGPLWHDPGIQVVLFLPYCHHKPSVPHQFWNHQPILNLTHSHDRWGTSRSHHLALRLRRLWGHCGNIFSHRRHHHVFLQSIRAWGNLLYFCKFLLSRSCITRRVRRHKLQHLVVLWKCTLPSGLEHCHRLTKQQPDCVYP